MKERDFSWHHQVQDLIHQLAITHCLSLADILAFLTVTLSGQLAFSDLSEEKVKQTLDRIFESYKRIKKENMEK